MDTQDVWEYLVSMGATVVEVKGDRFFIDCDWTGSEILRRESGLRKHTGRLIELLCAEVKDRNVLRRIK